MKIVLLTLLILIGTGSFSQTNYTPDKNHSSLSFTVKNFGITHVNGTFKNFEVKMKSAREDFTDAVIEMTAKVNSISTGIEKRDKDLLSKKWFDAEKHPFIIFKSKSFKKESDKNYRLEGEITIHGITKIIAFDVTYNGKVLNPVTKKYSVRFIVTGTLNRKDFKVGTEALSTATADKVEVKSEVEFIIN